MRKFVAIVLALALVGGAAIAVKLRRDGNAGSKVNLSEPSTIVIERGPISLKVSSTGRVVSNLDVEIKCKASGEIITLPFDVSDHVAKGDLLLELDPIDEERSMRQAEVRLASSQAKLTRAKRSLSVAEETLRITKLEAAADLRSAEAHGKEMREKAERIARLLEKTYASPEEQESAEAAAVQAETALEKARLRVEELKVEEAKLELQRQDVVLAECDVETDKLSLENAQQRLKETKAYAPMSGIISDRMVQVGQIISSPTNNVGGGTALMTLSDLSRVFVLASVDESDIGRVAVGQPVAVTVDAFPDERFEGEVVRVATKGSEVSKVVTFEVKIEVFGRGKESLLPEMTADVEILIAESQDALLVPSGTVVGRGRHRFVLLPTAKGEEPKRIPVEVGVDNGITTEIIGDVSEGMELMLPPGDSTGRWTRGGEGPGGRPSGPPGGPPGGTSTGRMIRRLGR
ncbi:MAG TPA: HlyD family efflux transporter periplasmic adaptor subunit [Candidatus Hydrogenedentes bacterium]|nr:HlyD family efflux transporter periplasmic adaptor subunit [Candidatus Hydrogenedentota bacterium]